MAPAGSSNLKSGDETEDVASTHLADARYSFEPEKLQELRSSAPWMKDPKYFKKVALSPSAIMKIMMHCHSGVEKGMAKGGNPIEVMGMLLGRPDPLTPDTLVVTDAFPLPIEGFETRVIADDENVVNHMIALGESLELTRKEKFMGWYHSHPFDLGDHSHCFLSQTDLSTELQWQRAEDPHGNPFVAIVVDPLRSGHLQEPELKAFRAYPPEYNSPVTDECPNGSIESSEQLRLEQWGSCWNRYYELSVEYYMSSTSRKVLEQLTQDYLWMRTLNSQPESNLTAKLVTAGKQFKAATSSSVMSLSSSSAAAAAAAPAPAAPSPARPYSRVRADQGLVALPTSTSSSTGSAASTPVPAKSKEWTKAVNQLVDAASDQQCEASLQRTKEKVFS
jgi:COP9 signalosome complex subunit 5